MKIRPWIPTLIFVLLLGAIIFQSFQNHCWNFRNVTYFEKPVFWQIADTETNEKTECKNDTISNKPFYMNENFCNAVFMVVGSCLAVVGGIFIAQWQRSRTGKDKFLKFIAKKDRIIDEKSAEIFHRETLSKFKIEIAILKPFLWRCCRWRLNKTWKEYQAIDYIHFQKTSDPEKHFEHRFDNETFKTGEEILHHFMKKFRDSIS